MALSGFSKIYPKWKESLMFGVAQASLNGAEGNEGVYVALIDDDVYTYSDTHVDFTDLTGVVASGGEILNKSITGNIFDGDDVTFTSVSGATTEAMVIYRMSGGVPDKLIAYIEEGDVVNLPLTPNNGSVQVNWHNQGIFSL